MLAKGAATKGDEPGQWWPCVIKGHKQIDVKHIEGSKYLDDSLLKKVKTWVNTNTKNSRFGRNNRKKRQLVLLRKQSQLRSLSNKNWLL